PVSSSSGFVVVKPHDAEVVEFLSSEPVGKADVSLLTDLFSQNKLRARAFARNARPAWTAPSLLSSGFAYFGKQAFQDVERKLGDEISERTGSKKPTPATALSVRRPE